MKPTYKYIASLVFIFFLTMAAESFFLTLELTRINELLIVISGALLWLGIVSINLKYQLVEQNNHSNLKQIILFFVSFLLNMVGFGILSNFTGSLLATLCVLLIAVFSLTVKHNRIYFYTFASSIVLTPIIFLLNSSYRLERVKMLLSGTSQETLDFLASTEKSLPELGIYGQQLFLFFLSNKVDVTAAVIIATAIILLWLYLFKITLKNKTNQLFYKRLALFITAFFIIQALVNVLTNLSILNYTLISNIMPISTNPAFWVFFVALVLCVIRINLKDRVFE